VDELIRVRVTARAVRSSWPRAFMRRRGEVFREMERGRSELFIDGGRCEVMPEWW
jgi:hypothetical protein